MAFPKTLTVSKEALLKAEKKQKRKNANKWQGRGMNRLRIVAIAFVGFTYGPHPTARRSFQPNDPLVLLCTIEGTTFFARVEDIPAVPPVPLQSLPEYSVESDIFDASTRIPTRSASVGVICQAYCCPNLDKSAWARANTLHEATRED